MGNIGETKVDLSDRKRIGPEDESREDQFAKGGGTFEKAEPRSPPAGDGSAKHHGIETSNDRTTP